MEFDETACLRFEHHQRVKGVRGYSRAQRQRYGLSGFQLSRLVVRLRSTEVKLAVSVADVVRPPALWAGAESAFTLLPTTVLFTVIRRRNFRRRQGVPPT